MNKILTSLAMLSGTLDLGILGKYWHCEVLTALAILQCYLSINYIVRIFKI